MCFVDLAYGGLVALCTASSNCLYTTLWIHLYHGGSRCMIHQHSLLVQPIWLIIISADKHQRHCTNCSTIIPGTLLPGESFSNMIFKAYSLHIVFARSQVGTLCENSTTLDVYGYVKYIIAPKTVDTYWRCGIVQMVATILAAFVQVGVKEWIFNNLRVSQLTCPQNKVFYTTSTVWWVFWFIYATDFSFYSPPISSRVSWV